jgi:uncharacterized protein YggT (Ycf19 family)
MFIDWSWWAFVAGILATITFQFWLVLFIAFRQWKKQRAADPFQNLVNNWNKPTKKD